MVPPQGRQAVLDELRTHPGCSKMKALARCYIWWLKMDSDIENLVKYDQVCQESRLSPPTAPLHPCGWPSKPWSRLHLDFAGPLLGHNYLVLIDAYSKWMDVQLMTSTTSAKTIEKFLMIFSTHGLPLKIVTDIGTAFTSNEFRHFMEQNVIKHITSAPYHPSPNGLAEQSSSNGSLTVCSQMYHRELNTAKLSKRRLMIPLNLSGILWFQKRMSLHHLWRKLHPLLNPFSYAGLIGLVSLLTVKVRACQDAKSSMGTNSTWQNLREASLKPHSS